MSKPEDENFVPLTWHYLDEPAALLPRGFEPPEEWTPEMMKSMLMDCMRRYYIVNTLVGHIKQNLQEFRSAQGTKELECELFENIKMDQSSVAWLDKMVAEVQKTLSRASDPRGHVGPSNDQLRMARRHWSQGNRGLAYGVVCEHPRRHGSIRDRYYTGCGNCDRCKALEREMEKSA